MLSLLKTGILCPILVTCWISLLVQPVSLVWICTLVTGKSRLKRLMCLKLRSKCARGCLSGWWCRLVSLTLQQPSNVLWIKFLGHFWTNSWLFIWMTFWYTAKTPKNTTNIWNKCWNFYKSTNFIANSKNVLFSSLLPPFWVMLLMPMGST